MYTLNGSFVQQLQTACIRMDKTEKSISLLIFSIFPFLEKLSTPEICLFVASHLHHKFHHHDFHHHTDPLQFDYAP